MRYISHELRTPLNTAFLGLKLLTDNMKSSKNPKDIETYDTLRDVNLSCTTALDILNDLLSFDKLESGILQLHKQEIAVIPFVTDCFAMFTVQARESGITMTIINQSNTSQENNNDNNYDIINAPKGRRRKTNKSFMFSSSGSSEVQESIKRKNIFLSLPFDQDDFISIDKFKMDQVVRNLISNSLKFTPKGGNITIQYYFQPDKIISNDKNIFKNKNKIDKNNHNNNNYNNNSPNNKLNNHEGKRNLFNIPSLVQVLALADDLESNINKQNYIDGNLVIEVTDNGSGISKENQTKLFTDIIQFNPEILQAGGGSGLGLWITHGIVDLHNGIINVFSEGEGKGCKFTVKIPMQRRIRREGLISTSVSIQADLNLIQISRKNEKGSDTQNFEHHHPTSLISINSTSYNSDVIKALSINNDNYCYVDGDDGKNNFYDKNNDNDILIHNMEDGVENYNDTDNKIYHYSYDDNIDNNSNNNKKKNNKNNNNKRNNNNDNYRNQFNHNNNNNNNSNIDDIDKCDNIYNDNCHLYGNSNNYGNTTPNNNNNNHTNKDIEKNKDEKRNRFPSFMTTNSKDSAFSISKSLLRSNHSRIFTSKKDTKNGKSTITYENDKNEKFDFNEDLIKNSKIFNSGDTFQIENENEMSKRGNLHDISYNLLVVDDSRLNRKMLCKILKNEGHTTEEAEDGLIAIQKVKERMANREANCTIKGTTYDAILMDFVMPNIDGPTATKAICAMGYQGPIFGVTGNALDSDMEYFIKCGAIRIFSKPLDVTEFTKYMIESIALKQISLQQISLQQVSSQQISSI